MIPPRHHFLFEGLLNNYTQWLLKKHFHSIVFRGDLSENNHSYLVIGNHTSWWDGFWMLFLNQVKLHRKFHVLMLEKELRNRMFFNRCGAFSIQPGSTSVKDSLQTTLHLLNNPQNMVLFFPEGEIHSAHKFPKEFQKGVSFLLKQLTPNTSVLLVTMLTDYYSQKKPTLTIYFKEWKGIAELFEEDYNQFYSECVDKQKQFIR